MRIEWSQRSRSDLRNLKRYIALDSPLYARQFTERLIASVEKLQDHPHIGRPVPEAEPQDDLRELIYQGYRILYQATTNKVRIVTVIHGSRDLAGNNIKP